jgi:hypothetical protein
MRDTGFTGALGGRIALASFALGLLFLSYRVLHPFLGPLAWGLILALCVLAALPQAAHDPRAFSQPRRLSDEPDAGAGLRPAPALGRDDRPLGSAAALQGGRAAAWATLVVGQIDNLFRPLVISSAAKIPYICRHVIIRVYLPHTAGVPTNCYDVVQSRHWRHESLHRIHQLLA